MYADREHLVEKAENRGSRISLLLGPNFKLAEHTRRGSLYCRELKIMLKIMGQNENLKHFEWYLKG